MHFELNHLGWHTLEITAVQEGGEFEHPAGMLKQPSLRLAEGADLFLRSHFTGDVLQVLFVKLLKAAEGIISKSLLLGCLHSHRHPKSFSPALDVPQHPYPFGCLGSCCFSLLSPQCEHIWPAVPSRDALPGLLSKFLFCSLSFNRLQQQ